MRFRHTMLPIRVWLVIPLWLAACAGPPAAPAVNRPPAPSAEYRLHPGDEIEVLFDEVPDLNLRQTIRSDGQISMPMVSDVQAGGRSVPELQQALVAAYRGQLVHPDITVLLRGAAGNRVFVGGEVNLQGAEPLDAPLTAARAIILAQGLKPTADASQVLVIPHRCRGPQRRPYRRSRKRAGRRP